MEVLGYTTTETLLWDYSEVEEYHVLVRPPARPRRTLYRVPWWYAYHWFHLFGGTDLRIVYYPFKNVHFGDVPEPVCDAEILEVVASIAVSPSSVDENGGIDLIFTITLDSASAFDTEITYSVSGTAAQGDDYTASFLNPITILAGQTTATITVTPVDDLLIESNETIIVTLLSGTSGTNIVTISPTSDSATGTIISDDLAPPPEITLVDENDGNPNDIITVYGQYFTGATLVQFIGNNLSSSTASFVFVDDGTLTVTVPSWPGGTSSTVDIRVTTPSGTSAITVDDEFSYNNVFMYLWPEESLDWAVTVNADRIWGVTGLTATYNSTTSPTRTISTPAIVELDGEIVDPGFNTWNTVNVVGQVIQDSNYVYYIAQQNAVLSRVPLNGTFDDIQTIAIPAGMFPVGSGGTPSVNPNTGSPGGSYGSVIRNDKLYMVWAGRWNNVYPTMGMLVIDLVAWNPTGFNFYNYSTDGVNLPQGYGICITDNGTIVISALVNGTPPVDGRIYYSNIATPSTWNFITLPSVQPGFGVSKGDYAYFVEKFHNINGIASRSTKLIIVNCTAATPTVSTVNMTDDPNFLGVNQGSQHFSTFPWVSDSHLFVAANYTRLLAGGIQAHHVLNSENPYIAKRNLVTGTTAGGSFLKNLLPWEWEFLIDTATFFNGLHYIVCYSWAYDSRYITLDEALTTATIWPNPVITNPSVNNLFANAITINEGDTLSGNSYYATYETNEPTPINWPGSLEYGYRPEHTVWYNFVAPTDLAYNIVVADNNNADNWYISVWTGSSVGSLTLVVEHIPTNNSIPFLPPYPRTTCLLPTIAGVTYRIRLSRFPAFAYYEGIAGLPAVDAESGSEFTVTIQPAQTIRQSMVFTPGLGGVYNYSVQWIPARDHMNAGTHVMEEA